MLKKASFIIGLGLLGILAFVVWTRVTSVASVPVNDLGLQLHTSDLDRQQLLLVLSGRTLTVEVVTQPASVRQGLSGRSEIGADGMLFVLGSDQQAQFWMLDMKFALDMIWLRDGVVVAVTPDIPAPSPGVLAKDLPLYSSGEPVDMVLEVPAGKAQAWQIKSGDRLIFLE